MAQSTLVGHTLGQYTVIEQLGRGGMADVYKAFHPQLEVYRAIKVIRPEFVTAGDFRARFQQEAQSVAGLRHPNIVQIHDFGEQDDAYYMVMEFVQGRDLKRIIRDEEKIRPIRRAVDIIDQVAGALHYAHAQGLIHRDIKPENIMISDDGLPILMDFGIAKLLTASTQLTQTGIGVGTPAYMAPEQAKALPEIGPAADIYSLSVVLYEMLTGRVPFSADTPMAVVLKALHDPMPSPRQISGDISESLQQVMLKSSAKDAKNRYQTARQFREALNRALKEEAPAVEPAATEIVDMPAMEQAQAQAPSPAADSRRYGRLVVAIGVLVAVIGIGSYLVLGPDGEAPSETAETAETAETTETVEAAEADTRESTQAEPQPESTPSTAAGDDAVASGASGARSARLVEEATSTEAGQPLRFELDANQGDVVYLQVNDTSAITDFTLVAPDGRNQVFKSHRNNGPVTLDADGTYTLSALTRGDESAQIDFSLWRLKPPVIEAGVLEWDRYVQGRTEAPGQVVAYTLEVRDGQTLFFDLAETSEVTDFTLTAPDGRTEIFRTHRDHGPTTLAQSGTYTLHADPRDDRTSEFEFAAWSVDPAVVDGGTLQFNEYVQGNTSVAGQLVSYELEVQGGQTLFFDVAEVSEVTDFILTAPDGRTEIFRTHRDHGPLTLEQPGTYVLRADPRSDRTSEFEFNVWQVDPAVIDGGALQFGEYVRGETSVAGQMASYTFEGQSGQTLFFELAETSETTDFTLIAPDGRTEVFQAYRDHGPFVLEQTGRYTMRADPRADRTSGFEFNMWHIDPAVVDGGSLQFDRYTKGQTTIPGQAVSYTLEAQSGQKLFFDLVDSSQTMDFTLTAPDGRTQIFQSYRDHGPVDLEQDGVYTLLADPRGKATVSYEFTLTSEE